jgi:hypothetical protein
MSIGVLNSKSEPHVEYACSNGYFVFLCELVKFYFWGIFLQYAYNHINFLQCPFSYMYFILYLCILDTSCIQICAT